MAENKILPWAQTETANVLSDSDYASDVASGGLYGDGVKTGQASSQQANKTWRQATAPASGLGQFLVDNLGVDVTDADAPETFSSRIANAVLKLAQISPFNQSWATATGGYRKYAIVSDSSGNFWVSTADQNTTTPGADGAKWQNLFNGYATEAWADGRYLQLSTANTQTVSGPVTFSGKTLVPNVDDFTSQEAIPAAQADGRYVRNNANIQGGIVALDLDYDGSGRVAFEKVDGSWGALQLAGDYATNSDLNTETTNRTNADTNLQNQINNRVLKTGDTSTGSQLARNKYDNGNLHWAPGWTSMIAGLSGGSSTGEYSFGMWAQALDGSYTAGILSVNGFQGRKDFRFNEDGNISTPLGTVALESDISNLQNQINGKQPAGNYVLADTSGVVIETFVATVTGNNQTVNLPRDYSKVIFVAPQNGTDGNGFGMTNVNSWTNSTANVSVASYHTGAPQGATISQTFLVIAIP